MIKSWNRWLLLFMMLNLASCSDPTPSETTSQTAAPSVGNRFVEIPDWVGTYQDTLPCADCPGTLTWIEFKADRTYRKSIIQLGKEPILNYTFGTEGKWKLQKQGTEVWLDSLAEKQSMGFKIQGDSVLYLIGQDGNVVPGFHSDLQRISKRIL